MKLALWWRRVVVLGGLKLGRKRLFVQEGGPHIQIEPVCLLDFYVCEAFQRKGVGFNLFQVSITYPLSWWPQLAARRAK